MPKKPETIMEDDYCDWVAGLKTVLALKLILFGLRGWPDRTIFFNGYVFFIEFKLPGKELSEQQEKWKGILTGLGFQYYTCFNKDQAIEITKHHMKLQGE